MSMYSAYLSDEEMGAVCSEEQIIRNMLRFEIALAKSQSGLGIISDQVALEIESVLKKVKINPTDLSEGTLRNGIPVIPMLEILRQHLSDDATDALHFGTTSQDVMDTAHVLMIKDAVGILEKRIVDVLKQCLNRIENDGDAPCIARTRWQQATPIPFGLKLLSWAQPLRRSLQLLQEMKNRLLIVQLGGPTGSLASFEEKGIELIKILADELDLNFSLPWHSQRDSIGEFANWLSSLTFSLGKMGQDMLLMSINEIGEITENAGGGGKSSSMPHKSNPVLSEAMVTLAHENSNLSSLINQSLLQTGERDATTWMAEWRTIPQLLENTAASLKHASFILEKMEVNRERMQQNIDVTNGLVYAKFAVDVLSNIITKKEAKEIVDRACEKVSKDKSLADILTEMTEDHDINWQMIIKPEACFGAAEEIIGHGVLDIDQAIKKISL